MNSNLVGGMDFEFEALNPCLRRSGFAQAGEIRNKHKCPKYKLSKQKVSNFDI
jgi:hypothetical protein